MDIKKLAGVPKAVGQTADGVSMVALSGAAMDRTSRNCVVGGFLVGTVGVLSGVKLLAIAGIGAMGVGFVKGFKEGLALSKILENS